MVDGHFDLNVYVRYFLSQKGLAYSKTPLYGHLYRHRNGRAWARRQGGLALLPDIEAGCFLPMTSSTHVYFHDGLPLGPLEVPHRLACQSVVSLLTEAEPRDSSVRWGHLLLLRCAAPISEIELRSE